MVHSHPALDGVSRTSQNRFYFSIAGTREVMLRQWSHLQKDGPEINSRWGLRGNGRCDSLYRALKDLVGQIWREIFGEVGVKEGGRCRRVCLETQHLLESTLGLSAIAEDSHELSGESGVLRRFKLKID